MRAKSMLILLVSMTLLVAGCSFGGSDRGSEADEQLARFDAAENLEPYELAIAFPIFSNPKDMQLVEEQLSAITKAKINATVTFLTNHPFAYLQQIPLLLVGNDKLDLMFNGIGHYNTQAWKGQLYPLNGLLDRYGQGIKQVLTEQNPVYLEATHVNGESYGIPTISNLANDYGFIMRKDLAEKHGIDMAAMKTFDDLEEVLRILKEKEPNMTLAKPADTMLGLYFDRIWDSLGDNLGVVMMNDQSLTVVNGFDTAEYKEIVTRLHRWYNAGYIAEDAATTTVGGAGAVNAGTAYGYLSHMKPGYELQEARGTGYDMVAARLLPPTSSTSITTFQVWSISRKSANPERAMMFLNLLYTDPEVINLLDWGIEGKHYVKVEGSDNVIDFPPGVDATSSGYQLNMGWMFGNQLLSHVWNGEDPHIWDKLSEFNRNATLSPVLGFSFVPDSVKSEIVAATKVMDQYRVAFETGTISPDKLSEFNAELVAAGIDVIIAEKQLQLDKWKASQPGEG
jgi:putative aldouronate transport system substrate-binding protein